MERDFDKETILKESKAVNQEYLECVAMNNSLDDLRTELQIKYHYIYSNFKSLFDISMSKVYDENRIKMMVSMAAKVRNNEISEHDASVKVGQVLVDEIVKPQLEKKK